MLSYTDEALAALTSPGLVRLAAKDVAQVSGQPPALRVGTHEVQLAEPLTGSTCSCAAHGLCRHILAAVMHCRGEPLVAEASRLRVPDTPPMVAEVSRGGAHGGETPPPQVEQILAISDEALQKWGGKALLERAYQFLSRAGPPRFEASPALVVRFPRRDVEVHVLGGDLHSLVCSCRSPHPCEHRLAAVLAYQTAQGSRAVKVLQRAALQASAQAARGREEVLSTVTQLLRQMLAAGVSRLSAATVERCGALSVSAHGVDLPRMERLLTGLATEASLHLQRHAHASTAALLDKAARCQALVLALEHPTSELVGVHRGEFEEVGELCLEGLGARAWESPVYVGLTLYFWEASNAKWLSWSDLRPRGQFDPHARYREVGPWMGTTLDVLSRSQVQIEHAWCSGEGRLSGREAMQAKLLGPSDPNRSSALVSDWSVLTDGAAHLFGGSLRPRADNDYVVLLGPRAWRETRFDDTAQMLRGTLEDCNGRPLPWILGYSPLTAAGISVLEEQPPPGTLVLGRLTLHHGHIAVEPWTLHLPTGSMHLTLDEPEKPASRSLMKRLRKAASGVFENAEEHYGSFTAVGMLLANLSTQLENLAEAGFAARCEANELPPILGQLDSLGLLACAAAVRKLITAPAPQKPEALLRCYYVVRLAARLESFVSSGMKPVR